jgi:uncharacterized caspase-like protein
VRRAFFLVAIAMLCVPAASAQSDGCRGASSALNRVKEEITPTLSPATDAGKRRLEVMESTLERGTRACKDFAELWYYREIVSQQLGQAKDAAYAKTKVDDLQFSAPYNPFTEPPAALPPPVRVQAAATKVHQKWALVIGIDNFKDKRVPPLHFSVKDSTDFVNFLEDPQGGRFEPSHIFHLKNETATREGIYEGLGQLRIKAQPDDLVVVYLSSHGSPRDQDPNGVSYIVTHDTNLDDPATLYATSLQMIDLVQQINREIKARRVVLVLDTCFSGDALTSLQAGTGGSASKGFIQVASKNPGEEATAPPAFSAAFQNLTIGYGRAVITASRANQLSWESATLKNGYFTHYLIDALRASHGNESLDHLFPQVRSTVAAHVKTDVGANQDPSYQFSEGADSIVIGVPGS